MRIGDNILITNGRYKDEQGIVEAIEPNTVRVNNMWIDKSIVTLAPLPIKIKYFGDNVKPEKHGDWYDLKSAEDITYKAGDFIMVSLGIAMELPDGYEAHVAPRSSTFKNFGVIFVNGVAVIDNAYKGDDDIWHAPLYALEDGEIHRGDRLCQFRLMEHQPTVKFIPTKHLGNANRGGLGSTGR